MPTDTATLTIRIQDDPANRAGAVSAVSPTDPQSATGTRPAQGTPAGSRPPQLPVGSAPIMSAFGQRNSLLWPFLSGMAQVPASGSGADAIRNLLTQRPEKNPAEKVGAAAPTPTTQQPPAFHADLTEPDWSDKYRSLQNRRDMGNWSGPGGEFKDAKEEGEFQRLKKLFLDSVEWETNSPAPPVVQQPSPITSTGKGEASDFERWKGEFQEWVKVGSEKGETPPRPPESGTKIGSPSSADANAFEGDHQPYRPQSPTTAFDRPTPVVVMGPKPLDVRVVSGMGGGGSGSGDKKDNKEEKRGDGPDWIERRFRDTQIGANRFGQFGSALAGNRASGMIGPVAETAAAGVAKLGAAAAPAAAGLQAVGAVASAAISVTNALVERGRELAAYNGQLAVASAQADVIRLRADLKEAEATSKSLSELIVQQAKAEATFREVMIPIKVFVTEKLVEILIAGQKLSGRVEDAVRDIAGVAKAKAESQGDELIQTWLKAADGLADPPASRVEFSPSAQQTLGIPLLGLGG